MYVFKIEAAKPTDGWNVELLESKLSPRYVLTWQMSVSLTKVGSSEYQQEKSGVSSLPDILNGIFLLDIQV